MQRSDDCAGGVGDAALRRGPPELWRRTTLTATRRLRDFAKLHGVRLRLSFAKVAEYQARGLIHFHA